MKKAILCLSALILVVGCMKSHTKDSLLTKSDINKPKTISIFSEDLGETKFPNCLKKGLIADIQNLKTIPQDEFQDALFPWFEPSTAPKSADELSIILNKSVIREQINKLGIDLLIYVSGYTIQDEFQGEVGGGGGVQDRFCGSG